MSFLNPVPHHVRHRHAGDPQAAHGVFQGVEPFLLEDDLHLRELVAVGGEGRFLLHGDGLCRRRGAGDGHDLLPGAEFGVFVDCRHEVSVCTGKSVLAAIEARKLIRSVCSEEISLFKYPEEYGHGDRSPGRYRNKA